jgi:outer membrane protein OmpA-like peptidoglycan-associated protein
MIGTRVVSRRRPREEAEKPFWISYSDLMTALMVLFLVVMGVALLAVTNDVTAREKEEEQHRVDVDLILDRLSQAAARYEGVKVDRERRIIDFGDRARFGFNRSTLASDQEAVLRRFVPEILELADAGLGRQLLKRVVVEGYADRTGTYLGNLNLSLQRSQRVLCAMFASSGDALLSQRQKERVRNLFLVGGYSFNASKDTDEASRRVEMRLEFFGLRENHTAPAVEHADSGDSDNFGDCALR